MRLLLAAIGMTLAIGAFAGQCTATSGAHTAALVELYTSEGCSSCPPADRWLSGLANYRGQLVPLALHVDYWDYIGWKDRYAKGEFSSRQRKLTQLQRRALVYTPQVLLQGREFRGWGSPAFDAAVTAINAQPARASIALTITGLASDRMDLEIKAALNDPGDKDAVLYVAAYENKLSSDVSSGENRGRRLAHDYVVLEWQGPMALGASPLAERRSLPLLPKAVPAHSGAAAFVQNRRTGEVLQALMLPACPA
ncbi:MAG TPA: DUF1223 domain-containing protein [Burkholderiales bacterium]|jgi:hypothetical protein|nr:DUF1223 domain-containing protein [Burkholderiales bacterium]